MQGGSQVDPSNTLGTNALYNRDSHIDSQPDLLALNADISRMAKELRLQMMELWAFRGKEM